MELRIDEAVRRPIKMRDAKWAHWSAKKLKDLGATPNQISVASVFFAALGALNLALSAEAAGWNRSALLIGGAVGIYLRLMCNLFDGMVAVEGGMRTKSGEVYNDFPDRPSDALILIGAGYSIGFSWAHELGWFAALLAVMTAYVRYLGGATGAGQHFLGPMAKQHRMATMIGACLASAIFEPLLLTGGSVMAFALVLISIGSVITIGRRVIRITRELESK